MFFVIKKLLVTGTLEADVCRVVVGGQTCNEPLRVLLLSIHVPGIFNLRRRRSRGHYEPGCD